GGIGHAQVPRVRIGPGVRTMTDVDAEEAEEIVWLGAGTVCLAHRIEESLELTGLHIHVTGAAVSTDARGHGAIGKAAPAEASALWISARKRVAQRDGHHAEQRSSHHPSNPCLFHCPF